jgi:hypothetical protein
MVVVTSAAEVAVVQGSSLKREGIATPTLVPEDKTREVESPSVTAIDALSSRVVAVIGVCLRRKLSSRRSILVATKVRPLSSTIGQKRTGLWRSSSTSEVQNDSTLIAIGVDSPASTGKCGRSVDLTLRRSTEDRGVGRLSRGDLGTFCEIDVVRSFDETGDSEWRLRNRQTERRSTVRAVVRDSHDQVQYLTREDVSK